MESISRRSFLGALGAAAAIPVVNVGVQGTAQAQEDLVLTDGTVIDKAYVTLRNRLNRIGEGFGGTPGVHGYDFFTNFWTVEEAQAESEMPLLQWFTAYDFACTTGRDQAEAEQMCVWDAWPYDTACN